MYILSNTWELSSDHFYPKSGNFLQYFPCISGMVGRYAAMLHKYVKSPPVTLAKVSSILHELVLLPSALA